MKDSILRMHNEAHNWENASPIGAGSLGAMVYGTVGVERISYNEETIWDGDVLDTKLPHYKEGLDHIREMFMEGKPAEAEKWAWNNFTDQYFFVKSYEAAGELFINLHRDSEVDSYERLLDLGRGIINVNYERYGVKYHRESFASHPAKLVCSKIQCEKSFSGLVSFVRPNIDKITYTVSEGSVLIDAFCSTQHTKKKFRSTAKLVTDGVFENWGDCVMLKDATNLEIFFSCVTAFRDESLDTMSKIAKADVGYEALKAEHVADFSSIMGRSDIYVGDDGVENLSTGRRLHRLTEDENAVDRGMVRLYFQFGKYLLVSSSREDSYPANLQGLWCDGIKSPWNSDYHTNINLQMNYWPAEIANIPECADALFTYMNECLLPGGRRVAKENYNARGTVVHHVADIYQFAAAADGIWGIWQLGAAWLSYQMWERYLYTGDKEFLRNTAYEFIRDSAVFFLDTMFEGPNGEILSGPSTSPENSYYVTVDGKKEHVSLAISPTMDIQIIGGLLDFYAEMEDILGIDPETAAEARRIRARMPKLKIGKYGQLQEWIEDFEEYEPGHRHISHAFGLFPAAQITRQTPEYYKAIRVSLDRRLAHGGGHTGWSRAWLINLFVRLRDGAGAYKNLRALLTNSTLYNLFDNHPPFQIDGNFGGCAAIAGMFIQSHEGFISLLPAVSDEMKDGYFEGLRARCNFTVSAKWTDKKITSLKVESPAGGTAKVELPDGQCDTTFVTESGECVKAEGQFITVPCGTELTLK